MLLWKNHNAGFLKLRVVEEAILMQSQFLDAL